MGLNKIPENIIPAKKVVIKTTPSPFGNNLTEWWEELQKWLKEDPHYLPLRSVPEVSQDELD